MIEVLALAAIGYTVLGVVGAVSEYLGLDEDES